MSALPAARPHPAVTVIALCYNHARFVEECLDSIEAQTLLDYQLIVTDDASTDRSPDIIRAWIASRRPASAFIEHRVNRGLCATLNEALAMAEGDYISMVATDDAWHVDKLQTQLDFMCSQPVGTAVVYSDAEEMDESGALLDRRVIEVHMPGVQPPSGDIFPVLADGNFIPAMSTLIRTAALREVGGYDEQLTYEDYDMWLRLAGRGHRFAHCAGAVARYRIVASSMVRTLFVRPTAAHSRSVIRLRAKWIDSGRLSAGQRRKWIAQICDAAYNLYLQCAPDATRSLWFAARLSRRPRLLLLAGAASLGIRRATAARWLKAWGVSRD